MGWFKGRVSLSLRLAGTVSKESMEQATAEHRGQPRERSSTVTSGGFRGHLLAVEVRDPACRRQWKESVCPHC